MPFNGASYRRNRYRLEALEALSRARRIKAGLERTHDSAYWLESAVKHARIGWRLYLSSRRVCELSPRSAPYRPAPFSTKLKESI